MQNETRHRRRLIRRTSTRLCALALLAIAGAEAAVWAAARGKVYGRGGVETLPHARAALVLGASEFLPDGRRNAYFALRIDAAARLHRAGKVEFLVVSGDNSRRDYNEPQAMKDALAACGVPEGRIRLDHAGFRTLDSVVRMREVFGQERFIVVSQRFHNERAVFIARCNGIDATGFNADDVGWRIGLRTRLRESLARVKAVMDAATGARPKFLGGKIELAP